MKYDKTSLFSKAINSEDSKVREEALDKREQEFYEFSNAGVDIVEIEELEYVSLNKPEKELKLGRVGKEWALTIQERLLNKYGNENNWNEIDQYVEEISIDEFTSDFEFLLTMLDNFSNIRKVSVGAMLSVNSIKLEDNHKSNYSLVVEKCSVSEIETEEKAMPKIKLKNSLTVGPSICGSVTAYHNIEDWADKLLNGTDSEFEDTIKLQVGKRFNKVAIFNKLFGTKLKSIKNMDLSIKFDCESELSDYLQTTKFGYKFTGVDSPVEIKLNLTHGDYELENVKVKFELEQELENEHDQ